MMQQVDVVIPTTGRPELRRAVASVRQQTAVDVRLRVVLDDPSKLSSIREFLGDDEVIRTSGGLGGAAARRIGHEAGSGQHVAFLDDDDWWEPEKLALQVEEAQSSGSALVLCSAVLHESTGRRRVIPKTLPMASGLADYIALRPRLKYGHGLVQSSCMLIVRELTADVFWDPGRKRHQDWAFALEIILAGGKVSFVNTPLVNITQGSNASISRSRAWKESYDWLQQYGNEMSPIARSDFVSAHVLRAALAERDLAGLKVATRELISNRPHLAAGLVGLSGAFKR